MRQLPKVELHRHLEGSLRLTTLVELARDLGIEIPPTEQQVIDDFLVTKPMKDLESVLKKFMRTQAVLSSEEILARITFEAIEDACHEGIRLLELRWAPFYIADGHPGLTPEKILRGIKMGLKMAQELPIAVGFISIVQRIHSLEEAEQVLQLTLDHRDFFVGIDLADNEVGFDPTHFEKIFSRAQAQDLPITIHAGEAPFAEASLNVKKSIELLGAQRIGHGLQIFRDPFIMSLVRQKGIPLELCPTSNWLTQSVPSLEAHPIRQLMEAGIPVTINSDDPGIFGIDLVHEYQVLSEIHHFTEAEFNNCNDVAAQASFIPRMQKQKFWPRPIHNLR